MPSLSIQPSSATPHPVDSTIRHCCGGIGRHTPECTQARVQPDPTAVLTASVPAIMRIRVDVNEALRAAGDAIPLFAHVDAVVALAHLKKAGEFLDRAAALIAVASAGGAI